MDRRQSDIIHKIADLAYCTDHVQALQLMKSELPHDTDDPELMVQKGHIFEMIGNFFLLEAESQYLRALDVDPYYTQALIDMGDYLDIENLDESLRYYVRAVDSTKQRCGVHVVTVVDAYAGKARILMLMGRHAEALQCVEDGLIQCPGDSSLVERRDEIAQALAAPGSANADNERKPGGE